MKKKKFPQEILVQWAQETGENCGDLNYLMANSTDEEACNYPDGGKRVGVYKLADVVHITDDTIPTFHRKSIKKA